jgi:hypothetical protein
MGGMYWILRAFIGVDHKDQVSHAIENSNYLGDVRLAKVLRAC